MQNIKLHKINELLVILEYIECEEANESIKSLDKIIDIISQIQVNYPSSHIYYKILNQLKYIATSRKEKLDKKHK